MKGVTPLIATVLLIATAVSIGAIIMSWSSTTIKEDTNIVSNKTKGVISCSSADITIRDVYIDLSSNKSRVVVWNSGQVDVRINDATVLSAIGEAAIRESNLSWSNVSSLPVGDLEVLVFSLNNTINSCANFSKALVTTSCVGISDKFDGTPKGC